MMYRRSMTYALLLFALPGLQAAAAAQPARPYTLTVKLDTLPISVSLKATNARVSAVAAELGTRLKAQVVLGPDVQNERITVDFPEAVLEMALISLAPPAPSSTMRSSTTRRRSRSGSTCWAPPIPRPRPTPSCAARLRGW
jgi:hypothetical protein